MIDAGLIRHVWTQCAVWWNSTPDCTNGMTECTERTNNNVRSGGTPLQTERMTHRKNVPAATDH
eukprot:10218854-Heterocapsa_arctica.AAC.1